MNILNMIIYFAKKNNISRRNLGRVIKDFNIMKKKGLSDGKILFHIPEWGKKIL